MRALLVLLLLLPSASAATMSPEQNTLWAIAASDEEADYRLTIDPENNTGVGGFWGNSAPYLGSLGSGREWVFTLREDVDGTVHLWDNGTVDAEVWIGGGTGEAGEHTVAWELKKGSTTIATGEEQTFAFNPAEGQAQQLTWSVAPQVESFNFTQGSASWRIYTTEGTGRGLRVNLDDEPGWTHVALPVLASAPVQDAPTTQEEPQESPGLGLLSTLVALVALVLRRRIK